jgi:hypothetical protein
LRNNSGSLAMLAAMRRAVSSFSSRTATGVILAIDEGQRLHDEARGVGLLDDSGRREAASGGHGANDTADLQWERRQQYGSIAVDSNF